MSTIASTLSTSTTKNSTNTAQDCEFQVFLGGSCNPTTWRQAVAIPYLETHGISYYNPQVENWTPDVVNTERFAKQTAQILLFVIDCQTRSTVSLIESAFMAGQGENLVIVIYPFGNNLIRNITATSQQRSNLFETKSKHALSSTRIDHQVNRSFTQSSSSQSSSSMLISSAHKSHEVPTKTSKAPSTTATLTSAKISTKTQIKVDDKILSESTIEHSQESSETIHIDGDPISVREFHELSYARLILQNLVALRKIPMFTDISQALKYVSSRLHDETRLSNKQSPAATLLEDLSMLSMHSSDEKKKSKPDLLGISRNPSIMLDDGEGEMEQQGVIRDVYLSLDYDDHTINESTVIPILKEQGLTYNYTSPRDKSIFLASLPPDLDSRGSSNILGHGDLTRYTDMNVAGEQTRLAIEKEIRAIKSSRVLLFVITNKCRGLSTMVPASHFMALFRNNVVLCVQYLEEPCSIGGELLTKSAINDYNRGRVYLCDYANKSQVPVFSTIREAIECCSRKCRRYNNKD